MKGGWPRIESIIPQAPSIAMWQNVKNNPPPHLGFCLKKKIKKGRYQFKEMEV